MLDLALTKPWATLGLSLALLLVTLYPLSRLGSEFMPPLDEGDLLYMPSTLPGILAREAARLLQPADQSAYQDRAGSGDGIRQSGPGGYRDGSGALIMLETTIPFKPKQQQWRPRDDHG